MIQAKEVQEFIDSVSDHMKPKTLARNLGMRPEKLEFYAENGIEDEYTIQLFKLFVSNTENKRDFQFSEIDAFGERMGYSDTFMQLLLDVNPQTWRRLRTNDQQPTPQLRKLFRVLELFVDEGFDVQRFIGLR